MSGLLEPNHRDANFTWLPLSFGGISLTTHKTGQKMNEDDFNTAWYIIAVES